MIPRRKPGLRFWRFLAAVLVALGLVLPLSTCTTGNPPTLEYHYVLKDAVDNSSCEGLCRTGAIGVSLLAFLWPLVAAVVANRRQGRRPVTVRLCVEPLLIALTAWWLYLQVVLRDPAIGFVTTVLGLTLYFAAWFVECASVIRRHRAANLG